MSCIPNRLMFCGLVAAAFAGPAFAHHSVAMYDRSKTITVKAVVRALNWTNPHSTLVVIPDGAGPAGESLTVEMSSPGVLSRSGWTKRSFNPGDHIELSYAPLRRGGPAGLFVSAVTPDGKTMRYDFTPSSEANLK